MISRRVGALADFAMQRSATQKLVKLDLLQTTRGVQALLVARRDVARRRLAFGFGFGAFEDDDVSRHDSWFG